MNTKLTLSLDKDIIERAKSLACHNKIYPPMASARPATAGIQTTNR